MTNFKSKLKKELEDRFVNGNIVLEQSYGAAKAFALWSRQETINEFQAKALLLEQESKALKKALDRFITLSNGLSIYVRNPVDELFLVKAGYEEMLKKIDSLYEHQCDVEETLSTLTKSKGE